MGKTTNFKLPYPEETDFANIPGDFKKLAEQADESMKGLIELIYPVGRGFISFTNTDYSNWLGLSWVRELVGTFPVGYNPNDTSFNVIGKKGGEKEHILTSNEMPSHTHTQNAHTHTQNSHNHTYTASSRYGGNGAGSAQAMWGCGDSAYGSATGTMTSTTATNQNTTATNQNTGGGQAHNNLPPYQVVSYWKRIDPNAIISFTIRGIEYLAREGMTWGEWCDSNYNTGDYESDTNYSYVHTSGGYVIGNSDGYPPEYFDVIIPNHAYGFQVEK